MANDMHLQVPTRQALPSGTDVHATPSLLSRAAHSSGAAEMESRKEHTSKIISRSDKCVEGSKAGKGFRGQERGARHGQLGSGGWAEGTTCGPDLGQPEVAMERQGTVWPGHREWRERKRSGKWGVSNKAWLTVCSHVQCCVQLAVCRELHRTHLWKTRAFLGSKPL